MTSVFLFGTLLAQSQFPDAFPQRRLTAPEDLQQVVGFAGASRDESAKRASVYQQYRFTTSFNRLKKALDEFADAYNQGTLDVKKIHLKMIIAASPMRSIAWRSAPVTRSAVHS
jgi:hypothetical protein